MYHISFKIVAFAFYRYATVLWLFSRTNLDGLLEMSGWLCGVRHRTLVKQVLPHLSRKQTNNELSGRRMWSLSVPVGTDPLRKYLNICLYETYILMNGTLVNIQKQFMHHACYLQLLKQLSRLPETYSSYAYDSLKHAQNSARWECKYVHHKREGIVFWWNTKPKLVN